MNGVVGERKVTFLPGVEKLNYDRETGTSASLTEEVHCYCYRKVGRKEDRASCQHTKVHLR